MKNNTLNLKVFEWLKSQILNFRLLPGVKISDKEVADQLGISRSPVREALNRLAEQGLVEVRQNRGFTVKVFTVQEIKELYTLRANLEKMAVGLTTENLKKETEESFKTHLDSYPELMQSTDFVAINDADERFHELIATHSGNALLAQVLKNLQGRIRLARRYEHLRATSFQETYDEHTKIFFHMCRGDVVKAQEAMTDHIMGSMKYITHILFQGNAATEF